MRRVWSLLAILLLLLPCSIAEAQEFFNLTADEVRIDTLLPRFSYSKPLGRNYADSVYTITIEYPEFMDMGADDMARCQSLLTAPLPEMPVVEQYVGISRKEGTLYVSFVPLVCRDGRLQKLVSFMLRVTSQAVSRARARSKVSAVADRYAAHSVLSTGNWAKIRVAETGIYQLTDALLRQAGFQNPSKVKVYGYGGALQPERLTADYLTATDDLQEVATCTVGGRRLFRAVGPVSWDSAAATTRTRNPYSDYGYYFLTESDDDPLRVDSTAFANSFYPSSDDYHSLYEVDDYAWFHGGRNLYDSRLMSDSKQQSYTLAASGRSGGKLTVVMSYDADCAASVAVNGTAVGTISVVSTSVNPAVPAYSKANVRTWVFNVDELQTKNTVTISQTSGGNMRLDYLALTSNEPVPMPRLSKEAFPVPEYVYSITRQNLHADGPADMIIIIPASQKLRTQAQRLKEYHEQKDGLRVRIIPADELYNEFSSGTPDANAYRRYLKMLYDRAEDDADMPRFLLLFGDGFYDNRLKQSSLSKFSADDFLLCYESENSFSETNCYVTDDYYCLMDDGEGANLLSSDKADIAVGRLTARSDDEAKILVDKALGYMENSNPGAWQNLICFMGDDGDNNRHMSDAEIVAQEVEKKFPGYQLKRIYWDAYQRTTSATGNSYPEVTRLIRQQMNDGALIMNYTGHGACYGLSHELVVRTNDFTASRTKHLPLWLTASCDIMPYDGDTENIGEASMLNEQGGAVAFYGTTRTVYSHYNQYMNTAFMRNVLAMKEGRRLPIGEAVRIAKNELVSGRTAAGETVSTDLTANKLQYTLLGDPALCLAMPTMTALVDCINGEAVSEAALASLGAGSRVTVEGHVENGDDFDGLLTAFVQDAEETIVCLQNDEEAAPTAFEYVDRPNVLYSGTDSVRNGRFSFVFAIPKDIRYADGTGRIVLYAAEKNNGRLAHGENSRFVMDKDETGEDDGVGPSIYCYLNSPSFVNGGQVNTTPYFYATLTDNDGINASGGGIGHDLQLVIDGEAVTTYTLNNYFQYDFGDYRSGSVGFSIPELASGPHKLTFRAWDVLNNSSTAELAFNVVRGLAPQLFSVSCTNNPATTSTTFIVSHDRNGSTMDVVLDVFDTSGRHLWSHSENGLCTDRTYTVNWDLTVDGGRRLQTGVYLYRVSISCDGSREVSKAKKLIVLCNK